MLDGVEGARNTGVDAELGLWRRAWSASIRHIPTIIAVGAITLYVLGIVATAGQLRATGLDVVQAMRLIPLETHLRNGVGIVISPTTLIVVGAYVLMYVSARATIPVSQSGSGPALTRFRLWWEGRIYPLFLAVLLIAVALIEPWTTALVIALIVVSWIMLPRLQRRLGDDWKGRRTELYILLSLFSVAIFAACDAYFLADPLPNGIVKTPSQELSGPLIASDGGLLYLGPSRVGGLYQGVATDTVQRLVVTRRRRPPEPSILNFIGVGERDR